MKTNHAEEQAVAQFDSVQLLVMELRKANESQNDERIEKARQAIEEDALEVSLRSGWQPIGNAEHPEIDEYSILLCTGGPAVRIIGNMNAHEMPDDARLEYQDWGTQWTEFKTFGDAEKILVEYADVFFQG